MDNKTITEMFHQVHNVWLRRWRDRVLSRHDPCWAEVASEAGDLLERYGHVPLIVHLIQDLLDELEERSRNEETRGEREK
jgi:hypothetical protein